jgi:tetratricopeptide (TPR) repeat protein
MFHLKMIQKSADFELTFLERLVKDNPDFVDALVPLADAYTKRGLFKEGLRIDQHLAKIRKEDPVVYYNLACSFALIGEKTKAITALRRAVRLGYSDFEHLRRDKDLEIVRNHPWVQSLGLPKKRKR